MNVTLRRTLSACLLAGSLALALALAAGAGSAEAESSVVGPSESIQKAINAAHPGDTILVKGVHREDVVIRKDGIKLRGEDAVIEPPDKADSPCAPEAICILGDMNLQTGEITGPRVSDVSVSGFTIEAIRDGGQPAFSIDVLHARNATVAANRVIDVTGGIGTTADSIDTTIANNHVIGSPDSSAPGIRVEYSSLTTIAENVVRNMPVDVNAIDVAEGSVDTTVAGNHLIDDWLGLAVFDDAPGTKVLSNEVSRFGIVGMYLAGQESANTQVVGNDVSGGPWGIFVTDAHQGSFVGNTVRDNCAGMFFEAFKAEPVGGFEVKDNTITDNTRSCRTQDFERNFSGIGIALLGARDMEVTTNHLSGNVPSGPTPISGGVVVATDPWFGGTAKPKNDSVIGNRFGRNEPDIFWDGSGSGNVFRDNYCDTSVPSSLCD